MSVATREEAGPSPPAAAADRIIRLPGAAWEDYERLLEIRGDRGGLRIAFLDGEVEFMSPSAPHEGLKSVIGCLLEAFCLARDIEFSTFGSWTLKDKAVSAGVEPDECYIFGPDPTLAPVPHLAIEVIWTSGGLGKLEIYRRLGVQEVWVWRRGQLEVHLLEGGTWVPSPQSRALPGIDLTTLAAHLDHPTTSQAIRAYRATLEP
ncbi:MAG: Uma2 family endonuclease [Deltaproteobacteria bacterium]|nr:Uma2 family endonuclease [Deltaproteobacteria bacterium]